MLVDCSVEVEIRRRALLPVYGIIAIGISSKNFSVNKNR